MSHRRKHPAAKTTKADESRDFDNQIATSITAPSTGGAFVLTTIEFDTDITAWTVVQGSVHEYYEVSEFDTIFKSDLATTAKGRIGQFYIPDPDNASLPSTGSRALEVAGSKPPCHIYSTHVARYYPPKKKLFCYDTASDRRFEMVGILGIWTEGTDAATIPGTWYIRMRVRFYRPVPASLHLTERSKETLMSALFNVEYQIPLRKVKRYVFQSDPMKDRPLQVVEVVDQKFHPVSSPSTCSIDPKTEVTLALNKTSSLDGPGVFCVSEKGDKPFAIPFLFEMPFELWKKEVSKKYKIIGSNDPTDEELKQNTAFLAVNK